MKSAHIAIYSMQVCYAILMGQWQSNIESSNDRTANGV